MAAEIIPFHRKSASPEDHEEKRRKASQKNEAKIRRDIRSFRRRLKNPDRQGRKLKKLKSPEEAVALQRRLGEWLKRIKSERGQLSAVLTAAGIRKNYRNRYALFEGENPGLQPIRKLEPYVRLADAIAGKLKLDREIFLHDLLSPFGVLAFEGGADDEDAWLLVDRFNEMALAVAGNTSLQAFFECAFSTPGVMNENGVIGGADPLDMDLFIEDRGTMLRNREFEGLFDHYSLPQPIPAVPLFLLLESREDTTAAHLGRRTKIVGLSSAERPAIAEKALGRFLSKFRLGARKRSRPVQLEIWREFSLAVGERNGPESIGPMFQGKVCYRIRLDGDRYEILPAIPGFGGKILLADDHYMPAVIYDVEDEYLRKEPRPRPGEPEAEHVNYNSYHAVSPWTVRRLLEQCGSEYETELLLPPAPHEFQSRLFGKVGRSVEHALISGLLEKLLEHEISALKDNLNNYIVDREAAIRKQDEAAFARWAALQGSRA